MAADKSSRSGLSEYQAEWQWRRDVWLFIRAATEHWKQLIGGSFVALIFGVAATMGFNVPKTVAGIMAFCLVVVMACFLVWRDERNLRLKSTSDTPRFDETVEKATIEFGRGGFNQIPIDGERHIILGINSQDVISAIVLEGRLQVDADVFTGQNIPVMKIRDNRLIGKPLEWDKNQNEMALEVVDIQGIPMLQLIYSSNHHAIIKGMFVGKGGVILLHDKGITTEFKDYTVAPIFKYPSWKYPGVTIDPDVD